MTNEERDELIVNLARTSAQLGQTIALGAQAAAVGGRHTRVHHLILLTMMTMVASRPELREEFKQQLANVREAGIAINLGLPIPDEEIQATQDLLLQLLPASLRP